MRTFIIFALLALTLANNNHHLNMAQVKQIQTLKEQKGTAGFIFELAELHMQTGGPFDELLEAIETASEDLKTKLEQTHTDYAIAQDNHETEVQRLNGLINKAITQIQSTQDNLNDVLYVLKGQLEQRIAGLEKDIEEAQEYIKLKTAENKTRHEQFLIRQQEHQEAIEVLNKCVEMLGALDSDGFSLAQIKEKKTHIQQFHKEISAKSGLVDMTLMTALINLATSEFVDRAALQKVIDLLNESRNNLAASLAKEIADDKSAEQEFQDDMRTQNNRIQDNRNDISDATQQLEVTNNNIEESLNFIARRKADLAKSRKDLEDENAAFEETTKRYEELVAQINSEMEACDEALQILQKGDIADYIMERVNGGDANAWQAQEHGVNVNDGWDN